MHAYLQGLERAQQEGAELKTLFQFTFIPMMQEQVCCVFYSMIANCSGDVINIGNKY